LAKDRQTAIVLVGIALYGAGYGAFLTNVPAFLIAVKGFNPSLVGIFFSLFYVAISASQVLTGQLSDKYGRKLFMIIGLYTSGIGALYKKDVIASRCPTFLSSPIIPYDFV
jgi:MFS family permease